MDDGIVLRADVFMPDETEGRYPVILTYGPYAKGLAFQDGYPSAWQRMVAEHPDVARGSSNRYQSWEVVDPEKWVPEGYAVMRVDSRGAGRSPGRVDPFLAARDPICTTASNGRACSTGRTARWASTASPISPPTSGTSLRCSRRISPRSACGRARGLVPRRHASRRHPQHAFWAHWYDMQVKTVQHGLGERGPRSRATGALVCGDATLSDQELRETAAPLATILAHPLDDAYHRARSPAWEKITVPLLSAANWGGQGLHPRGNYEGFARAASKHKAAEAHGIEH